MALTAVGFLLGHKDKVTALSVTIYGKYLVSGSRDTTVKMWLLGEKAAVATFTGHTEAVLSVGVTPDGRYVVSG